MIKKNIQVGEVVQNQSGGCAFVVEKEDVGIINDNKWNYSRVGKSFGNPKNKFVGKHVTIKSGLFGLGRKRVEVMRSPVSGEVRFAGTKDNDFCLHCGAGIPFDENIILNE